MTAPSIPSMLMQIPDFPVARWNSAWMASNMADIGRRTVAAVLADGAF